MSSNQAVRERATQAASEDAALVARARVHAALGDVVRLTIVDALVTSDRSPTELAAMFDLSSNLLAHHLDVLESAGVVQRSLSAGDGRRKYVRLVRNVADRLDSLDRPVPAEMLFVCTRNSARSQLAAALWTSRTGHPARSAGTRPAAHVHRGAVTAARRAGLDLRHATPQPMISPPTGVQVVTVCDLVHEELEPGSGWWHWSIPDPVERDTAAAFDAVLQDLDERIRPFVGVDVERVAR